MDSFTYICNEITTKIYFFIKAYNILFNNLIQNK